MREPDTFLTADGRPMASATVEQMREIDRIAVEETGPSLLQMMENAGRSLAVLVMKLLGARGSAARVLVLAGGGGNGGGGVAAARHLAGRVDRIGVWVADPARLSDATCRQLGTFRATGSRDLPRSDLHRLAEYDLVIDALVGYGLRGRLRGSVASAIEAVNASGRLVVSLDLPSGVGADGEPLPDLHVRADATLALHLPKPGLAAPAAGMLLVADLGIPAGVTRRVGLAPPSYGPAFIARLRVA